MSLFGEPNTCFDFGSYGGHYNYKGEPVVDWETGTDADFDSHSVDVQNGEGYYDDCGHYVSYYKE